MPYSCPSSVYTSASGVGYSDDPDIVAASSPTTTIPYVDSFKLVVLSFMRYVNTRPICLIKIRCTEFYGVNGVNIIIQVNKLMSGNMSF